MHILDREPNMIDQLVEEHGHSLIIGHRGYAKDMDFHRNTLPAFKYAIETGCQGIEGDLRITKDGKIVIHHNPWVSNGLNFKLISKNTYEELVDVVGSEDNLPLVDEVLKLLPNDMVFFCQIKDPNTTTAIIDHLENITSHPERIFFMGYMADVLDQPLPNSFTYGKHYLNPFDHNLRYIFDRIADGIDMPIASPMWNWLTDGHLKKIHDLNLQSVVFTINPEKALKKYIDLGSSAIYTDSLIVAQNLV